MSENTLPTYTLDTMFGPVTLTVEPAESQNQFRSDNRSPRRHYTAVLGEFRVNGRNFGGLTYRFSTDAAPFILYQDMRAWELGQEPDPYPGAAMTKNMTRKVRDAIETAFETFHKTPAYGEACRAADAHQRDRIFARAQERVSRLEERISQIRNVASRANSPDSKPEEIERELERLFQDIRRSP